MTIVAFDPKNLDMLRTEIQSALDEVAKRHGIKLQMKTMRYDPTGASFTAPLEGKAGAFEDVAREKVLRMAKAYGVDASKPSENPRAKGAVLMEYRAKSRTRPWSYELGGKMYVTTDDGLRALWPKTDAHI